jgi:hypothetical protein
MTSELAKNINLAALVEAWNQAQAEVWAAHELLETAEKRLKGNFNASTYQLSILSSYQSGEMSNPKKLIERLKRDAWQVIVDRMEIRRVMSVKRAEELDKKLREGELPEITEAAIFEMMDTAFTNVNTFIEEAIKEVFEILRPRHNHYKTNSQFDIGERVILSSSVTIRWGSKFDTNHYREKDLRALDNVFHSLDGKGLPKTHYGPLIDAIKDTSIHVGKGETDYFEFKCFRNCNLHLKFKRMDLVKQLNAIAGGNRLYANRNEN